MSTLQRIMGTKSLAGDKGAAAIVVAISLLVLLGFTALAIDGSSAYNERRGSQNAADNAALAAAWQQCNPDAIGSTPENAARRTAEDNGYDDKDPNVTVTPTEVSSGVWQVVITTQQAGIFGQATPYAPDNMTVVSEAVAECAVQQYLGGYALFSGGYGCSSNEMSLTSSDISVTGGVYSNEDLDVSGSSVSITGDVENRDPSGGSDGTYDIGPPRDYPVDVSIDDYRPGGTKRSDPNFVAAPGNINNTWLTSNGYATAVSGVGIKMTKSGIYYSPGSISLKNVSAAPGITVTFVSEGAMDFQQPVDLTGYDQVTTSGYSPILMFSNHPGSPSCNATAIKFSTSGLKTLTGLIYAPNGSVDFSAADVVIDGSVLAYMINASTSSLTVNWQDAPGAEPDFTVELLQ